MRLFLLTCALLSTFWAYGQVGVGVLYNLNEVNDFAENSEIEEASLFGNTPEYALHYWFRLKNYRVEFMPTLSYSRPGLVASSGNERIDRYGAQFKVNVYPFDLKGDCDCPTFGKQGPKLEKGFFLQLAPGYTRLSSSEIELMNDGNFTLGVATGIDFGISNLLTLTPVVGFRNTFGDLTGLTFTDGNGGERLVENGNLTIQLGLQATFRFDHKRY